MPDTGTIHCFSVIIISVNTDTRLSVWGLIHCKTNSYSIFMAHRFTLRQTSTALFSCDCLVCNKMKPKLTEPQGRSVTRFIKGSWSMSLKHNKVEYDIRLSIRAHIHAHIS